MMGEKITVKVWMAMADINARGLAQKYKKSEQFVGRFLKGKATSEPLANFLINKGCPKENFKNGKIAA